MTGIHPQRSLLRIRPKDSSIINSTSLDHTRAFPVLQIDQLQKNLENMHKDIHENVSLRYEKSIAAHNKATDIQIPSVAVGDFVLLRSAQDSGSKLHFRWFGPCRVTAVHSPLVYSITPLRGGRTERIHSAHLIRYQDSRHEKEVRQETLDLADRTQSSFEITEIILDKVQAPDGLFLQV